MGIKQPDSEKVSVYECGFDSVTGLFRPMVIDEGIASITCVEAKKEALARRKLQVRQLLTPPGI